MSRRRPTAVLATALLSLAIAPPAGVAADADAPEPATPDNVDTVLSANDCVAIALARSATVKSARSEVDLVRAQAAQVEALLSPSVSGLTFIAPLFSAEGGFGLDGEYRRDLGEWGPYAHADAQLVVPLSTFGRFSAARAASRGRVAVEREKARERAHAVRAEVRRLYYLRLYAASMIPSLENGHEILQKAIEKATEMFEEQTGAVTVADRMKLAYGDGEVERYLRMARDGVDLATLALKQAMGLPLEADVRFADDTLSLPEQQPEALAQLLQQATRDRPEMGQIKHGKAATAAWREAEKKAYMPSLFVAAVGRADWSPVRPRGLSAIGFNQFNDWFVGAATGLQFDLNPARARARTEEAAAKGRWVDAQAELAATGIPLQVRKAHQEYLRNRDLAAVAEDQVKSTRKWMTFSAAGYSSGTAEAKDVLEGVGAYLLSKKNYYDHALGVWQALVDLEQHTGRDSAGADSRDP